MTDFYIVYYLSRSTRARGGGSYCSVVPAPASSLAAPVICLIKFEILVSGGPQVTVSSHLLPWQGLSSLCALLLLDPAVRHSSEDSLGTQRWLSPSCSQHPKRQVPQDQALWTMQEGTCTLLPPSHPSLLAPLLGNAKGAKREGAQTHLV